MTEPVEVTLEAAKKTAREIVRERGVDHTYAQITLDHTTCEQACAYFDLEGNPSCIVGIILFRLGLEPIQYLPENWLDVSDLRSAGLIEADDVTVAFLDDLQSRQDAGFTWSSALNYAELRQIRRENEDDHAQRRAGHLAGAG